jgi:predicted transcriptional regulator
MNNEKHRGEIIEKAIRVSGFSIKTLSERLNVSRNTIYNKFKEHDLSYDTIIRIGDIIKYDFTVDFPEIKTSTVVHKNTHLASLRHLERKYTILLERYNSLLTFLIRLANDYNIEKLKRDIDEFLDNSSSEK